MKDMHEMKDIHETKDTKNMKNEDAKIWLFFGVVAIIVTFALVVVLSGSKKTMNADELRKGVGDKVAFVNPERMREGSVVCPKDHTHGYPVCATCKKIMQPLKNGLYICPECGRIGIPICPECGELMQPVADPTAAQVVTR